MRRAVIAAALMPAIGYAAQVCSWDKPGHDPFMGDVVAAVDHYTDIPASTRAKIQARMQRREYDDIAAIRRDSIEGRHQYAPEIRGMHFGQGRVCATVTRARWTSQMVERGLVYCEDGHCILVPTVCRNVSRIKRLAAPAPKQAGGGMVVVQGDEGPIDISPSAGIVGGGMRTTDPGEGFVLRELPAAPVLQSPSTLPPSQSAWPVIWPNQPTYIPPVIIAIPAPVPVVPEPRTAVLMALGVAALWGARPNASLSGGRRPSA